MEATRRAAHDPPMSCIGLDRNKVSEAKYASVRAAPASRTRSGGIHPGVPAVAATAAWAHRNAPADTNELPSASCRQNQGREEQEAGTRDRLARPRSERSRHDLAQRLGTNERRRNDGAAVQGADSSPLPEPLRRQTREHQRPRRGSRPCRRAWPENCERPRLRCARPRV